MFAGLKQGDVHVVYSALIQEYVMNTTNYTYTLMAKMIHMGVAVFGIAAYLTAEGAEHGDAGLGYLLHAYLGMTLAFFILLRIGRGYVGSSDMRFENWSPFSRRQLAMAVEDIKGIIRFNVPERGMHQGIAGLVQAFGLIIFAWMGGSGSVMFFIDETTSKNLFEILEELHEVGEGLIPLFLLLHVGAVIVHSAMGKQNWKKMWRFSRSWSNSIS
jgi:cytochrome b